MPSFDMGGSVKNPLTLGPVSSCLFLKGAGTLQHVAWLCWRLLASLIAGQRLSCVTEQLSNYWWRCGSQGISSAYAGWECALGF